VNQTTDIAVEQFTDTLTHTYIYRCKGIEREREVGVKNYRSSWRQLMEKMEMS